MKILFFGVITFFLLLPDMTMATQAHGDPEGIYAHQLAHLFFMLSMVIFIYWLRQRNLIAKSGWRYIQYAAFCFILWNISVILVHLSDEQTMWVRVQQVDTRHIQVLSSLGSWMEAIYYLAKMDHLICVPALLFLFFGLKKLADET
ncbi:MAG: hypothetical protein R6U27_01305 [Desulfobacterales bacterium]